MRHKASVSLAIAVLLLGLLAPSAGAHYRSHRDPRDTEGLDAPRSRIDIDRVRLRIDDGDAVVKITTYGALAGWGRLRVEFDSRGGPRMDRYADVWWDEASGGWLERGLFRRGGDLVGDLRARRGEDALRLRFPKAWLRATRHMRWRVTATLPTADGPLVDDAPDTGWYDH
jgi:hypothetical protein